MPDRAVQTPWGRSLEAKPFAGEASAVAPSCMPGFSQWDTSGVAVCTCTGYTEPKLNKPLFIGVWKKKTLQFSHRNRNVIQSFKIPCFEDI